MDRNTACCIGRQHVIVALRKESVDRNLAGRHLIDLGQVALRKESVDRNPMRVNAACVAGRRSPQGERG